MSGTNDGKPHLNLVLEEISVADHLDHPSSSGNSAGTQRYVFLLPCPPVQVFDLTNML